MLNERKKIAVVFNRMLVGGAEKALLNFLYAIDKKKYDVTLFTFSDRGAYYEELPKDISIVFTENKTLKEVYKNDFKNLHLLKLLKSNFWRFLIHIFKDDFKKFACTMMCYPAFDKKFDCVISYKLRYEDVLTARYKITAPKNCVWVHGNPLDVKRASNDELWFQKKFAKWACRYFQKIYVVSDSVKEELCRICPTAHAKTDVFYNLIDSAYILQNAEAAIPDCVKTTGGFLLVTVGRLETVKGQLLIPKTTKMLLDAGYKTKWYLIGDGSLRPELEREIETLGVQEQVILLGTKDNPYPYMKACDIYVQTSYSEGFGLTVAEAKILHKPIVTTDAGVMSEQINSGENGLIVPEATSEALYEGIKTLLDCPELREKFVRNLKNENYDASKEMQKLYDFIES